MRLSEKKEGRGHVGDLTNNSGGEGVEGRFAA